MSPGQKNCRMDKIEVMSSMISKKSMISARNSISSLLMTLAAQIRGYNTIIRNNDILLENTFIIKYLTNLKLLNFSS